MTPKQLLMLDLIDRTGEIPADGRKVCPGVHFCPDYDYLAVCDDSPEAENCTCSSEMKGLTSS